MKLTSHCIFLHAQIAEFPISQSVAEALVLEQEKGDLRGGERQGLVSRFDPFDLLQPAGRPSGAYLAVLYCELPQTATENVICAMVSNHRVDERGFRGSLCAQLIQAGVFLVYPRGVNRQKDCRFIVKPPVEGPWREPCTPRDLVGVSSPESMLLKLFSCRIDENQLRLSFCRWPAILAARPGRTLLFLNHILHRVYGAAILRSFDMAGKVTQ